MPRKPRTQRDPLLEAVIAKLPARDAGFPAAEREAWLKLLVNALDVAYGRGQTTDDRREMEADIRPPSSVLRRPAFHVDAAGFARGPDGRELLANHIPQTETLWDLRPNAEAGNIDTIIWADGTWPASELRKMGIDVDLKIPPKA